MNINFNDSTYEKLKFLGELEGRSVAAYVSMRMDELAGQLVNTTFTLNDLPKGTVLAHLQAAPRVPRDGEQGFFTLPSDSNA